MKSLLEMEINSLTFLSKYLLLNIGLLLDLYLYLGNCQLIVNVKSQAGEIFKETFITNTTDDSVSLEFSLQDGSYITQIVDFKQELQIFRIMTLGEEELGQNPYQVNCFVTRFSKGDFISSDAMSKLRQKNPTTIRTPEGDHGVEDFEMNLSIDVEGSSFISNQIPKLCHVAKTSTFASEREMKMWITQKQDLDWDWNSVREATHRVPLKGMSPCGDNKSRELLSSCSCNQQVCVSWYPCGLKYCTGKDNSGKTVSYRCGIRTCRKCYNFNYVVARKASCLTFF